MNRLHSCWRSHAHACSTAFLPQPIRTLEDVTLLHKDNHVSAPRKMAVTPRLLVCLLLSLAVSSYAARSHVREETFSAIKNSPSDKIVVFYDSQQESSLNTLDDIEDFAQYYKDDDIFLDYPIEFLKCDSRRPENRADFEEAQFNDLPYVFTNTKDTGIERYYGDLDIESLMKMVNIKLLPVQADWVLDFEHEDSVWSLIDFHEPSLPVFVEFYEEWCGHCQQFRKTFAKLAEHFATHVHFMAVECSENEETKAFCTKNDVRSYPTMKLFTEEDKILYEENRTFEGVEQFIADTIGLRVETSTPRGVVPKPTKNHPGKRTKSPSSPSSSSSRKDSDSEPSPSRRQKKRDSTPVIDRSDGDEDMMAIRIQRLEKKVRDLEDQLRKLAASRSSHDASSDDYDEL